MVVKLFFNITLERAGLTTGLDLSEKVDNILPGKKLTICPALRFKNTNFINFRFII